MPSIKALVLTGFGLNCDYETAYALQLAGAAADRVHINALIDGSARLDGYRILVFGGGFGWGDDHGAGVIQAVRMKTRLGDQLIRFVGGGNLVIGICNGFQALVNLGLLPGFDGDYRTRSVALTYNDCGNFRDDWVALAVNPQAPCVFTRGMAHIELPIRHGEGKFYADPAVIERLVNGNQVVLRYAGPDGHPAQGRFPHNPNGSVQDIAGICDPTGRVFGLMPHPEAYNHPTNHPLWTRQKQRTLRGEETEPPEPAPGVRVFINAVEYLNGG
jgi:phosphoribosylformylglycinamidine synthase I